MQLSNLSLQNKACTFSSKFDAIHLRRQFECHFVCCTNIVGRSCDLFGGHWDVPNIRRSASICIRISRDRIFWSLLIKASKRTPNRGRNNRIQHHAHGELIRDFPEKFRCVFPRKLLGWQRLLDFHPSPNNRRAISNYPESKHSFQRPPGPHFCHLLPMLQHRPWCENKAELSGIHASEAICTSSRNRPLHGES